jgi:hypothetical protein
MTKCVRLRMHGMKALKVYIVNRELSDWRSCEVRGQ